MRVDGVGRARSPRPQSWPDLVPSHGLAQGWQGPRRGLGDVGDNSGDAEDEVADRRLLDDLVDQPGRESELLD
jgi:hypothetical protein